MTLKTLFLQPPSFDGFDGGAGSRYQARREIKSFWFPTWLAQPAALLPDSTLIDAPPAKLTMADVLPHAKTHQLLIIHTSTPSFANDVKVAEEFKKLNPEMLVGFIGAKVAVQPEESLARAKVLDFVCGNEFDFTIKEIAEGKPLAEVQGIWYRGADGQIVKNEDRPLLMDMDELPFVVDVYKKHLRM
ncbi:MAG TPA: hopanoid biosynthesis associated radical SAM protein HpnJ, partial [Acidocella sp.]|nr:hopanoid biosynthesis associated radical SAM protein HpnJ [Acidocella sp.]